MKLLIWDFDGTLAYRVGRWTGALVDVLHHHGYADIATEANIRPHLQRGFPWHTPEVAHAHLASADAWWAALAPVFITAFTTTGISAAEATRLAAAVRATYCQPAAWAVYADTCVTLQAVTHDGWTQVILSNHVPELPDLVTHLGLDTWITTTCTSATLGYEKPHSQAFQHVLTTMGVVEAVWMIGDNPVADVAGAAAVGIPGILVRATAPGGTACNDLTHISRIVNGAIETR